MQGGGNYGGGGGRMSGRWYRAKIVVDTKGKRIPAGLSADVDIETEAHKRRDQGADAERSWAGRSTICQRA